MVLQADPSRARDRLGWQAQTSLEDGLRATIDWLRTQPTTNDPDRVQT
jgi:nucleoside-diphosphate-sugar epimerase